MGSKNRKTLFRQQFIQGRGFIRPQDELPHEFLYRVMRGDEFEDWYPNPEFDPKKKDSAANPRYLSIKRRPNLELRIDCGKSAAPYYAPRLSAVEVTRNISDEQIQQLMLALLADGSPDAQGLLRLAQEAGLLAAGSGVPGAAGAATIDGTAQTAEPDEDREFGDDAGEPVS